MLSKGGFFFDLDVDYIPSFQMLDTQIQRLIFGDLTSIEAHKKAPRELAVPRGFLVTLKRL